MRMACACARVPMGVVKCISPLALCACRVSTSNQLEAELVDLCESLAAATGRTLTWTGGSFDDTVRPEASSRCLRHAAVAKLSRRRSANGGAWCVYILHAPEAEGHARRLKEGIEGTLAESCTLEAPTALDDSERFLERVARSKCVVVLQTRAVLTQPWALLAAYRASLAKVPMVCVLVSNSGYDFASAQQCLEGLSACLEAADIAQMRTVLSGWTPPGSLEALQARLSSIIPATISVLYDPEGTANALAATARDIRDKMRLLQTGQRHLPGDRPSGRRLLRRSHVELALTPSTAEVVTIEVSS